MIKEYVMNTIPGGHTVRSFQFFSVTPLKVKLGGLGYDIVLTDPVGRQVRYFTDGRFYFGATMNFPAGIQFYALIKS